MIQEGLTNPLADILEAMVETEATYKGKSTLPILKYLQNTGSFDSSTYSIFPFKFLFLIFLI